MGKQTNDRDFLIQLGKNLQKIRKEKNINQLEIARLVSVHRTYIGMVERGERNPTITTIYKIAEALKIDISELLPNT